MKEITVEQDIYNKHGNLLVAKGASIQIDKKKKKRYKQLGLLEQLHEVPEIGIDHHAQAKREMQQTLKFYEIKHIDIFSDATDIIRDIIGNSKEHDFGKLLDLINKIDLAWLYSHCINTALMSTMVGLVFRFRETELYKIAQDTLIMDVGMALIPKSLLYKKDRLDANELKIVQDHCELGMAIVHKLAPGVDTQIIMEHHERLDGSGYPYGLKGDEISKNSQIVMVADVVNSMTSKRPHRHGMPLDIVLNQLKRSYDKFSQDVITALNMMLRKS